MTDTTKIAEKDYDFLTHFLNDEVLILVNEWKREDMQELQNIIGMGWCSGDDLVSIIPVHKTFYVLRHAHDPGLCFARKAYADFENRKAYERYVRIPIEQFIRLYSCQVDIQEEDLVFLLKEV